MDITSILGVIVGLVAVVGGLMLEGGHIGSILQPTAAMIVLGGALGATLVAFPKSEFMLGLKALGTAFTEKKHNSEELVKLIVELAGQARRDGILSLENQLPSIHDPFLARALAYLVDGRDAESLRALLEAEVELAEGQGNVAAAVYEAIGGFAPTVGVLGAVLGLIHVMEQLNDPSKLGSGIAVAFVATVYGVGAANLLFLPLANKLKRKVHHEVERKNLIITGVTQISAGEAPRQIESKLRSLLEPPKEKAEAK